MEGIKFGLFTLWDLALHEAQCFISELKTLSAFVVAPAVSFVEVPVMFVEAADFVAEFVSTRDLKLVNTLSPTVVDSAVPCSEVPEDVVKLYENMVAFGWTPSPNTFVVKLNGANGLKLRARLFKPGNETSYVSI